MAAASSPRGREVRGETGKLSNGLVRKKFELDPKSDENLLEILIKESNDLIWVLEKSGCSIENAMEDNKRSIFKNAYISLCESVCNIYIVINQGAK